jgi:predicted Zn-dependent peptidase
MQLGVGGVHEAPGTTGIAHLLEHMLFKGSETVGTSDVAAERELFADMDAKHEELLAARTEGDTIQAQRLAEEIDALEDQAREFVVPNEFDRILTRAGAQGLNATTTNEATTYFVEFPSNRAELFFALESDRMANPVFREFYSERDVVMEERRMRVDTSPGGALYEAHMRAAFAVHPYGQPVVGTMDDLEALRRADVEAYYQRFYGPGNAVLVVVGSFDPDQIEGWARAYFGSIPAGDKPPAVTIVEPLQSAERRVEVTWDAQPALRIGWHVPEAAHPDAPALAMLSVILTGGRTSRLYRSLVTERKIAAQIFSSMGPGTQYPQLFQIDAAPIHPNTPASLEAEIYAEIARLVESGPTEDEVARVRNQIAAGSVRRMTSNLGLSFQLAGSESLLGDWRETFRASARLQEVTPEDVRRVASQYLVVVNRTVATLVPTKTP